MSVGTSDVWTATWQWKIKEWTTTTLLGCCLTFTVSPSPVLCVFELFGERTFLLWIRKIVKNWYHFSGLHTLQESFDFCPEFLILGGGGGGGYGGTSTKCYLYCRLPALDVTESVCGLHLEPWSFLQSAGRPGSRSCYNQYINLGNSGLSADSLFSAFPKQICRGTVGQRRIIYSFMPLLVVHG
jgi:hypothetical protein